jgi:hypothetical protein
MSMATGFAALRQALIEVSHAQQVGANWFTHGADGLYRQVSMWIRHARQELILIDAQRDQLREALEEWDKLAKPLAYMQEHQVDFGRVLTLRADTMAAIIKAARPLVAQDG